MLDKCKYLFENIHRSKMNWKKFMCNSSGSSIDLMLENNSMDGIVKICVEMNVLIIIIIIIRFSLALVNSPRNLKFLIELSVERLQRVSALANHIVNNNIYICWSANFRLISCYAFVCVCVVFFRSPILALNQRNILFYVQFATFPIVHKNGF